jgi:hypothetical protein
LSFRLAGIVLPVLPGTATVSAAIFRRNFSLAPFGGWRKHSREMERDQAGTFPRFPGAFSF